MKRRYEVRNDQQIMIGSANTIADACKEACDYLKRYSSYMGEIEVWDCLRRNSIKVAAVITQYP